MFEKIRFDLDHRGARAEAEAAVAVAARAPSKKARQLILDKPFWVILRRSGSRNPYFLLGCEHS